MIFIWTAFIITSLITIFFLQSVYVFARDLIKATKSSDKEKADKEAGSLVKAVLFLIIFALLSAFLADKIF